MKWFRIIQERKYRNRLSQTEGNVIKADLRDGRESCGPAFQQVKRKMCQTPLIKSLPSDTVYNIAAV